MRSVEEAGLEGGNGGTGAFAEGRFSGGGHDTPDFGTVFGTLGDTNELRNNLFKQESVVTLMD